MKMENSDGASAEPAPNAYPTSIETPTVKIPNRQSPLIWKLDFEVCLGFGGWTLGFLRLAPLIHPVVYRFVPKPRILRFKHPMPFIREIQHLGRNPQSLQRREELKSFAHIEPIIVLAVDHQRRRFEFVGEQVR